MRIAVIGDSHFDETSRFDECVRIHDWIARDMRERDVDLVLHSGDVFERKSTPRERRAVADWLKTVAELAPVIVVRGNHDVVGDLSIFSRLRTRHPIVVEEAAGVFITKGVAVACLAWPRKAELLSRIGATSHEQAELGAREALRAVLRGLGQQLADHDGPRILLSHAMVRGSRVSTGQPLLGCDMELGIEDLSLVGADAIALGHIHLGQDWSIEREDAHDAPVFYPGSPRRTAYGEVEAKGYVLMQIEVGEAITWERIETPCAPMLLVEDDWSGDEGWIGAGRPSASSVFDLEGLRSTGTSVAGAEVRFRFNVRPEQREQARTAAAIVRDELLAEGALVVKLDERVIATSSARAPAVAIATTLADKLRAAWAARGDVPDEERAARLISMAHGLEEDAARAA